MTCTKEPGVQGVSYQACRRVMALKSLVFSSSTNKTYFVSAPVYYDKILEVIISPSQASDGLAQSCISLHLLA